MSITKSAGMGSGGGGGGGGGEGEITVYTRRTNFTLLYLELRRDGR